MTDTLENVNFLQVQVDVEGRLQGYTSLMARYTTKEKDQRVCSLNKCHITTS